MKLLIAQLLLLRTLYAIMEENKSLDRVDRLKFEVFSVIVFHIINI